MRAVRDHIFPLEDDDDTIAYSKALFNGLRDDTSKEAFLAGIRLTRDAVLQALNDPTLWKRRWSLIQIQNLLQVQLFNHIHTWAVDRGIPMEGVWEMLNFAECCAEAREGDGHD
jgi:hypothetical protein